MPGVPVAPGNGRLQKCPRLPILALTASLPTGLCEPFRLRQGHAPLTFAVPSPVAVVAVSPTPCSYLASPCPLPRCRPSSTPPLSTAHAATLVAHREAGAARLTG